MIIVFMVTMLYGGIHVKYGYSSVIIGSVLWPVLVLAVIVNVGTHQRVQSELDEADPVTCKDHLERMREHHGLEEILETIVDYNVDLIQDKHGDPDYEYVRVLNDDLNRAITNYRSRR
jgi:hypothetical protein